MRTAILCLALAACTSDDSAAPTISNLTYSPSNVTVGQQATISGTMTFDDPDGDLDQMGVEITLPDNSKQQLAMTDLQNVGSMTDGQLGWALIVVPPMAGAYKLELWLTDAVGHESNRLQANATAQ